MSKASRLSLFCATLYHQHTLLVLDVICTEQWFLLL